MEEDRKISIIIKVIMWITGAFIVTAIIGGLSMFLLRTPVLGYILSFLIWILVMYFWLRNVK